MSGRDYVKLGREQIEDLWSQVKDNNETLMLAGCCRAILRGHPVVEIIVDRWPDWRSLAVKPAEDRPKDHCPMMSHAVHLQCKDLSSLGDFLQTEGVLDWNQAIMFVDINAKFMPVLKAAVAAQSGRLSWIYQCQLFTANQDALSDIDVCLPAGYMTGELSLKDTQRAFDILIRDDPEASFKVFNYHVRYCSNVCVRDPAGELIGYEFMRNYGAQGVLHVDPAHRRKGLAKYLTVTLAKKIINEGLVPFCYIVQNNLPSVNMHQACGYKALENYKSEWYNYIPSGGARPSVY